MSSVIKIRKGLDIRIKGKAEVSVQEIEPEFFAIQPADFIGVTPKLTVEAGDVVKVGTPLFRDRRDERITFAAPASGVVTEIRRGEKRHIEAVVIRSDNRYEALDTTIGDLRRDTIIQQMLENGLWPMVRQRPFSTIANPDTTPKAFFISAFDTAPLAPDIDFVVEHFPDSFAKGLEVLSILSGDKVHLCVHEKMTKSDAILRAKATIHTFSGPHPSGNISTQINKVCPIAKGDIVWYCYPQDVINIGSFFRTGRLDFTRIFAAAGTGLSKPQYFKTRLGAQIHNMACNVNGDDLRYISGNVLTGKRTTRDGFLGFYSNMLTVIPEGNHREEMLGWIWPGFRKYSVSRTFPNAFLPSAMQPYYDLDTNTHGEQRPFVVTGTFEKVFPLDIYPLQLIKACITENVDLMENLGIYEVDEEDFALCEFIDTSKNDIQQIIRKGLDLMRKETE